MILKKAILIRYESGDQGTFSVLGASGFNCHVVELPWRDNKCNISCIPTGDYICKLHHSRKFGTVYHLQDVQGRTWVLTHSGNVAGDVSKGWKTHSAGCLIVGKYRGKIGNQKAVLCSKPTLREFMKIMDGDEFKLTIMGDS